MANILCTDLFEQSAYLIRSLLRGMGHAVSIAVTREDCEEKLSTGLFDLMFVDYTTVVEDNLNVARFAAEQLPGMPVIGLTSGDSVPRLKAVTLESRLERPIRGQRLRDAVGVALAKYFRNSQRRAVARVHTKLPVGFSCAGIRFDGSTIDISPRGVAIDTSSAGLDGKQIEKIENSVGSDNVSASLTITPGVVLELKGHLAFVERHRAPLGRTIGVAFNELDAKTIEQLQGLEKQAA